ncbi:MAG: alpha/beta fold hydrolase [Deltaproteobacteria bacterium]|nr:alpha/beta fold hydrolase [Deltaproteobacteria bacterium]
MSASMPSPGRRLLRVFVMPLNWTGYVLIAAVLVSGFFYFYPQVENFFVFHPHNKLDFSPSDWDLKGESVAFRAADGTRLHGWFFPPEKNEPVILFSHGNAGNISHRLDNVKRLAERGLGVFVYDYRGYGKSQGSPSEAGIYQDGLASYDYLVQEKRIGPEQIVCFGRSLGAAVAIEIALRRVVKALIVESGFTSTRDMAGELLFFQPISSLLPLHYNNLWQNSPRACAQADHSWHGG